MTYYQFVQAVEGRIKEAVKESVAVRIHTAEKNNGTIRRGLTLTEQDINISPTIYLEEYYRQFQNGGSLEHITSDILRLYNEVRFQKSWGEEKLYDYSQVKEKVIYRLVNYESNEKMLRRQWPSAMTIWICGESKRRSSTGRLRKIQANSCRTTSAL